LEKAGNAHANYYATLMQDLEDQMKGFRQVEAFNLTELEFENIRTAWNWFIERGQSGLLIEKILLAFFLYCEARWRTWDTFPLIRQTREKLDDAKSNNENTLVDKAVLSLVELTFYTEFFHLRQIADFELWWGKALPLERVTFAWNVLANKSPKEVQGFWLILSTEFFAWHSLSQSSVQHLRRLIKHSRNARTHGFEASPVKALRVYSVGLKYPDHRANRTKKFLHKMEAGTKSVPRYRKPYINSMQQEIV
jgi:hypothetical protein